VTLAQDISFGLRMIRKNPALSAVAVLALTLGIGANATVFTIVNAFLFQNLPIVDSDRILYITSVNSSTGKGRGMSYPDFRDFQAQAKSFQSLGAFAGTDLDVSDRSGMPAQYKGARVTANTFDVIGQKPITGRGFLPGDAAPGAPPVAMLSYSLWQNRYGKDPSITGATIRINEVPTCDRRLACRHPVSRHEPALAPARSGRRVGETRQPALDRVRSFDSGR